MERKEKISLITCTYNRLNHLKLLLDSLKIQSLLPDELIISDDGSKEDIEKFLELEFKNEKKIKVVLVKQQDLGFRLSRARNNGARVATGDLLIFIDSDIVMPPKFIEIFYENRKNGRINMSRSVRLSKKQTEEITSEDINKNDLKKFMDRDKYNYVVQRYYKNKFYSIFMKNKQAGKFRAMAFSMYKEDYIKIDGMDEKFIGWGSEDVEFGMRAYHMGIEINNSHKNNFQLHLWHGDFEDREDNDSLLKNKYNENSKKFNTKLEYGYSHTYGEDQYEVIEIC